MRLGWMVSCLLVAVSPVLGQEEPPPLAGPRVEAAPAGAQERHFAPTERERAARERLRARILPGLLRELSSGRAPTDLRLSESQREKIEALRAQFHETLIAHIENRKDEIIDALRTLGMGEEADRIEELDREGGARIVEMLARAPRAIMARLVGEDRMRSVERGEFDRQAIFRSLSSEQQGALRHLIGIQRELPTEADLSDAILDVLDEAQRRFVDQRIDQAMARARDEERRRARRAARPGDRPADAMESMQAAGEAAGGAMMDLPSLRDRRQPDRLDRLLERLTPEQREVLADFIERRLLEAERRWRKPPPSMDEVKIPPPDEG